MKNYNQSAIAREAGICPGHLSAILSGVRRPQWQTAKRLAEVTKTDPVLWVDAPPEKIKEAINKAAK